MPSTPVAPTRTSPRKSVEKNRTSTMTKNNAHQSTSTKVTALAGTSVVGEADACTQESNRDDGRKGSHHGEQVPL